MEDDMRSVVLQMGISIDGYVSGGPEEDVGAGGSEHPDVVARKLAWITSAGAHARAPDGTVISIYRRPRTGDDRDAPALPRLDPSVVSSLDGG
jgi:hypothetical protein